MPLKKLQQTAQEIGRIRLGKKTGNAATSLSTFRLTSANKAAIEQVAKLYGGKVTACTDKDLKGQFETTIQRDELPCYVAPVPVSQYMEAWESGECLRRCDQETELLSGEPCKCEALGDNLCRPKTRMAVILYDVPGIGVWRVEAGSWEAARSLGQTAQLLSHYAGVSTDFLPVSLAIEQRSGRFRDKDGKKKMSRWVVPVIRCQYSPAQLLSLTSQAVETQSGFALPSSEETAALDAKAESQEPDAEVEEVEEQEPEPKKKEPAQKDKKEPEKPAATKTPEEKAADPNHFRKLYFARHSELGYPPHDRSEHDDVRAINYEVWSGILGKKVKSAADFSEKDWEYLGDVLYDILNDKAEEPEAWRLWRIKEHPVQIVGRSKK